MPDPIISELLDMFPDDIIIERWLSDDAHGNPTWDTANAFTVKARIVGRTKTVADKDGNERVSSVQATLAGAYNVGTEDRYTLPLRFSVNPTDPTDLLARQPKALAVDRSTDENGAHHETVQFSNARIRSF